MLQIDLRTALGTHNLQDSSLSVTSLTGLDAPVLNNLPAHMSIEQDRLGLPTPQEREDGQGTGLDLEPPVQHEGVRESLLVYLASSDYKNSTYSWTELRQG